MIAVELRKMFRRPRTWATIGVLNALPVLVAVLLVITDLAPRPGEGPPFLSAVLSNGALYPLAALAIVLPLFLPIAVAVVAGDSVAGEAQAGTLRYLLARPAGRTRLLVAKLVAVLAFVLATVLVVAGVGYVVGATLFEAQPAVGTSVSGTSLTAQELGDRTLLAIGYVAVSMLGVAAFALFFSTLTDSPLGATMGALAVLVDVVAAVHPGCGVAHRALPAHPLLAGVRRLLPRPDPLARHRPGPGAAGGLRRRAARRRLGELHDEGRHERSGSAPEAGAVVGRQLDRLPGAELGEHHRLHERVARQVAVGRPARRRTPTGRAGSPRPRGGRSPAG